MKKEFKNLITMPCPKCKWTILNKGMFFGLGSFQVYCKRCDEWIPLSIGQKFFLSAVKIALVIIFIATSFYMYGKISARKISCDSFSSYSQALIYYQSDPLAHKKLDWNKNKVPCENLIK